MKGRRFIRHPADIPIEIITTGVRLQSYSTDLCVGGVAFQTNEKLVPGVTVEVIIACVHPVFRAPARVVWSSQQGAGFAIGVQFIGAKAQYKARMVEQVCHIESYRARVFEKEGRRLTADQAAAEWIAAYAADFPAAGSAGPD